jgi:pimeloyl-ACP methyl ester carboxylesterase
MAQTGESTMRRAAGATTLMAIALAFAATAMAAPAPADVPAAIFADPPIDAAHPAQGEGVQFESHGAQVNAQLYRPAGEGAHPTVVLLHGLPGNEQNLDLARVMQRAGWTVITFHYRGSWGSGGAFTLKGGVEDAEALLARLRDPAAAKAWKVDPRRIVLIGHSYGGMVAAQAAAGAPDVLGAVLIAPWDPSFDARTLAAMPQAKRQAAAPELFNDVAGRLGPVTPRSLVEEIVRDGPSLDLEPVGERLAGRRLLVLTATRDDDSDKAIGLLAGMKRGGGAGAALLVDTDHGFNDHRIALETAVLRWLAALPGAPPLE